MNRLERALGILLHLRASKTVSAQALARRFEVSTRTIYRDVEMLSASGIPVYAEMGRDGGFRLMEGYFLPPVMFTIGEAVSLLLGLDSLSRFRAKPFAREVNTAEQKLRAAVPDTLRDTLIHVREIVGFEAVPRDVYSQERLTNPPDGENFKPAENQVLDTFLQAILEKRQVRIIYMSPYRARQENAILVPGGMFWDRDYWYLVATPVGKKNKPRLWRADRISKIQMDAPLRERAPRFDIAGWMGRRWLEEAMREWEQDAPVKIIVTAEMAERLQQDWYYKYARYETAGGEKIQVTFGADRREFVFELLRWLGPGAELIEPRPWREELRAELAEMARAYL